jgi:hypothetical protein
MKSTSLFLLSASLLQAGPKSADILIPEPPTSGWAIRSISAGAAWRSFGEVEYRGSSRSRNALIPSRVGGDALSLPAIGTLDGFSDRAYQDGYVNQDRATGSSGDTWFWGYDSVSQVQGNELLLSAIGARSDFSESRNFRGERTSSDDLRGLSPQIDFVFSTPVDSLGDFLVSFWHFSEDSEQRYSNFSANQLREDFRIDFTDRYDISAILPIPTAPYAGGIDGPGPLLTNIPLARERMESLVGGDSALFSNEVEADFDLNAFSLAIGPILSGRFSEQWHWQLSGGFTANLFKWEATQRERLTVSVNGGPEETVQSWRESNSGTDFRFGVYAKGELAYYLDNGIFFKGSFQAEIADDLRATVGDSSYHLEPGGYALGLSMGKRF